MDITPIIEQLNDAQREAVTTQKQNCLVLAGAGSGKTRVLVHRIAFLLQTLTCHGPDICAVTFTNKAAAEMRQRIQELIEQPLHGMWLGTFHSLSHRMLRLHYHEANLQENFQILDQDDQLRQIKKISKELQLDEQQWPARKTQYFINQCKEQGKRSSEIQPSHMPATPEPLYKIYKSYEDTCHKNSLVDFTELLLRSLELLQNNPEIKMRYQERFKAILIDEFQDTNTLQYQWLKALTAPHTQVMAVGDDDQSIYSWRGAQVSHMHQFTQDFPPAVMIKLEQNYRSTHTILKAANTIISHNQGRLGKNLWTNENSGECINVFDAYYDIEEARFVIERIQSLHEAENISLADMAVLYRSNAQSRLFEEQLNQARLPYRVYGGFRFFDRAEIRDALSYIKLSINPNNDPAFDRIVNNPPRGIGLQTCEQLRHIASERQCSMWQAIGIAADEKLLTSRSLSALCSFKELIDSFRHSTAQEAYVIAQEIIENCGLINHLKRTEPEKGQAKIENLHELVTAIRYQDTDNNLSAWQELNQFIDHISFQDSPNRSQQHADSVQLMTLHAAKGLEFKIVFLVGLEEELFPHRASMHDPSQLEEERRLCYVGITRAKERLFLSHSETRRLYGQETYQRPSRFLQEIPQDLLRPVRQNQHPQAHSSLTQEPTGQLQLNDTVQHPQFGTGVILNIEGNAPQQRVQVHFKSCGSKWLLTEFACLQKV